MLTLRADETYSFLIDNDLGPLSVVEFDPLTANAAAELSGGTMYVAQAHRLNGLWVVTHANNPQTDRDFLWVVFNPEDYQEQVFSTGSGIRKGVHRHAYKDCDEQFEEEMEILLEAIVEGRIAVGPAIEMAERLMVKDFECYLKQGWPKVYARLLQEQEDARPKEIIPWWQI